MLAKQSAAEENQACDWKVPSFCGDTEDLAAISCHMHRQVTHKSSYCTGEWGEAGDRIKLADAPSHEARGMSCARCIACGVAR